MNVTEVLPDSAGLRASRRARVLAAMEAAEIDILVIGSEANARYVAGVPRLWLAGSKPFGPGCIFVRATQEIHLVSTWDEGVPDDIPKENLHGITFNSANTMKMLKGVSGAATAKLVATDGFMPGTAKQLGAAFPEAELVDGQELMLRVRSIKLPDEVEAIRTSIRIAEQALSVAEAALTVGVTERHVTAVFMEAMASLGITTPTTQDVACISSRSAAWARSTRDTAVGEQDLVIFDAGVIAAGYVGELVRTRCIAGISSVAPKLVERWDELWDRLIEACRPGATGKDFFDAYAMSGVELPPVPIVRGLGLGSDLPLVSSALPRTSEQQRVQPGQVLTLTAYVWEHGVGAVCAQEPVLMTESGPELLSAAPFRDSRSR